MGKEIILKDKDYIVSKTDLSGKIIYGNEPFVIYSGYKEEELINKPHNIIRHPDMPKIVFKLLWERVKNKNEIFAFVKNLTKNGDYYWVFANVTPTVRDGVIINYHSVRRKPNPEAINIVTKLYKELIDLEKSGGINASERHLNTFLKEKGVTYDELIKSLQG